MQSLYQQLSGALRAQPEHTGVLWVYFCLVPVFLVCWLRQSRGKFGWIHIISAYFLCELGLLAVLALILEEFDLHLKSADLVTMFFFGFLGFLLLMLITLLANAKVKPMKPQDQPM